MTDTPTGFDETMDIHDFMLWLFEEIWERGEDGKITPAEISSFLGEFVSEGMGKLVEAVKGATKVPGEFKGRKASAYLRFVAAMTSQVADELEATGN